MTANIACVVTSATGGNHRIQIPATGTIDEHQQTFVLLPSLCDLQWDPRIEMLVPVPGSQSPLPDLPVGTVFIAETARGSIADTPDGPQVGLQLGKSIEIIGSVEVDDDQKLLPERSLAVLEAHGSPYAATPETVSRLIEESKVEYLGLDVAP